MTLNTLGDALPPGASSGITRLKFAKRRGAITFSVGGGTKVTIMKLTPKSLRILLVDDDENDVELLRVALEESGFTQPVTHFRNGSIALEYFKYTKATGASAPHLILLDLNMPLVDGVRALHRLREVSSFRELPVIILTGAEDKVKRQEAARLGIFRFLTKQLHNANVIAALHDFIAFYNHELEHPTKATDATFAVRGQNVPGVSRHSRIHFH